jgi:hypothetical protein
MKVRIYKSSFSLYYVELLDKNGETIFTQGRLSKFFARKLAKKISYNCYNEYPEAEYNPDLMGEDYYTYVEERKV